MYLRSNSRLLLVLPLFLVRTVLGFSAEPAVNQLLIGGDTLICFSDLLDTHPDAATLKSRLAVEIAHADSLIHPNDYSGKFRKVLTYKLLWEVKEERLYLSAVTCGAIRVSLPAVCAATRSDGLLSAYWVTGTFTLLHPRKADSSNGSPDAYLLQMQIEAGRVLQCNPIEPLRQHPLLSDL